MRLRSLPSVLLLLTASRFLVTMIQVKAVHRDPQCTFGWRWLEVSGGDTLTLTSPNYPASYDPLTLCGWTIWPSSKNVIMKLKCKAFHLQESVNGRCRDFVRIQQVKYCGSSIPDISISNVSRFSITFHTNRRLNYQGFHCSLTATNPNTQHCVCGEERSNGTVPWMAALVPVKDSKPFCSASIVGEHWVLTSATCAARIKYNRYSYEVLVGMSQGRTGVRLPIRKVLLHPTSTLGIPNSQSNLALIHLKQAIAFRNDVTLPVCLPQSPARQRPALGELAWQGWRGTKVEEQQCLSAHRGTAWLCGQPKDTCHAGKGDLGSALVSRDKGGGWVQIGVAVGGDGCLRETFDPHEPAVYINIMKHLSWISRTLHKDNTCPNIK